MCHCLSNEMITTLHFAKRSFRRRLVPQKQASSTLDTAPACIPCSDSITLRYRLQAVCGRNMAEAQAPADVSAEDAPRTVPKVVARPPPGTEARVTGPGGNRIQ